MEKIVLAGADISYTSYVIVDNEGNPSKSAYIVPETVTYKDLLKENVIGCSTVLLSKRIAQEYRFRTDFYHEDYCLWLELLRNGHKVVGCSEVLVDWRLLVNSRSFHKGNSAKNRFKIYRNYLNLSIIKSLYLILCYAVRGIEKYYS